MGPSLMLKRHSMPVSKKLLWERKKVVLSSLGFLVPAILHYKKNEVFLGFLLMLMSVCSLQFYLLYKGGFKISLFYISLWILVYGTLFYQGVIYRPDITSTCIWLLLLVRSAYKGYKIQHVSYSLLSDALHTFMKWNLYLCLLCLGNYYIRDVSQPIVLVDFIKGMFWGVCLIVSYVLDFNAFMTEIFYGYLWRFKPTRMDVSMKEREDDLD
jgi:hypothetical protein